MKVRVNVTVKPELVRWMDDKVKEGKYSTRSHAVTVALQELRKKETEAVKL